MVMFEVRLCRERTWRDLGKAGSNYDRLEDTAPERPAARAKGVSPSAMPMTMSRTTTGAEKSFSIRGVVGMRSHKLTPAAGISR